MLELPVMRLYSKLSGRGCIHMKTSQLGSILLTYPESRSGLPRIPRNYNLGLHIPYSCSLSR